MALDAHELQRLLDNIRSVDDPGTLVLADWLQAQDHPWGELIAMQHAAMWRDADAQVERYAADILGPLADMPYTSFDWRNGFVRRASIGCNAEPEAIAKALALLVAQPIAHVTETIAINTYVAEFPFWNDWSVSLDHVVDPWTDLDAIAKLIPARVTRVGFGGWPAPAAAGYVRMPSFAKLSMAFPALTALELTGTCLDEPGAFALPELAELEVRFAEAQSGHIAGILTSKLPKLERLSVWLGGNAHVLVDDVYPPDDFDEDNEGSRYPATFDAADLEVMGEHDIGSPDANYGVEAILEMELPQLVHLGFPSTGITPAIIATIANSELVKQLKTLDLSKGTVDDECASALVAARAKLAHLESIDVSDCKLTAAGAAKLTEALPNANVGTITATKAGKRTPKPVFHFRYVAAME